MAFSRGQYESHQRRLLAETPETVARTLTPRPGLSLPFVGGTRVSALLFRTPCHWAPSAKAATIASSLLCCVRAPKSGQSAWCIGPPGRKIGGFFGAEVDNLSGGTFASDSMPQKLQGGVACVACREAVEDNAFRANQVGFVDLHSMTPAVARPSVPVVQWDLFLYPFVSFGLSQTNGQWSIPRRVPFFYKAH